MPEFDYVIGLWEDGRRRLAQAEPRDRAVMERVVDVLVAELRRRLGGTFSADELADLYLEGGTDWCFELATKEAPGTPAAWDMATVANAAFARYVRAASDYGGGSRRLPEE